ncbi:MAG: hypothetical protein MI741_03495 [Rhodospirillales bacterium]|nr:hypothetical protein [Rhodospirillales bacterium]
MSSAETPVICETEAVEQASHGQDAVQTRKADQAKTDRQETKPPAEPGHGERYARAMAKRSLWTRFYDKFDDRMTRLSAKSEFWRRFCSRFWLPLAYRSGIKFHRGDENTFTAVLPFRRFNKNWYNAMAGAALLGNAEVAAGTYVFKQCGANYTVVCKHLEYDFLRPCVGPAAYHITPREDLTELLSTGNEFNLTIDMVIVQMVSGKNQRERRVGKCTATFHVAPKKAFRQRKLREKAKSNGKG